jgi:chromosome partitioning protein
MICTFFNHKGGVGKTTTTLNLAAALKRQGKSILLVDIDPQANLTTSAGIAADVSPTVDAVFREQLQARACIVKTSSGDVIPSTLDLSKAERDITNVIDRERILKRQLEPLRDEYDYILIDCPPSLGNLSINGIVAADKAFIPVQTEMLALKGLPVVLEIIDELHRKRVNPSLEVGGIIATMYDERKVVCKTVMNQLRNVFGDKVFSTLIRDNVALAEAPASGKSIFEYAPKSHGATDYEALCMEFLRRVEKAGILEEHEGKYEEGKHEEGQEIAQERSRSRGLKRAERNIA